VRTVEAGRYQRAADLWVVTCFFNPVGYRAPLANYFAFAEKLRQSDIPLLTVECAFFDAPFEIPSAPEVLQVRSRSVLFQKEQLLNHAIRHLPPACTKVAWIDADVLFTNPAWAVETSRALEHHSIVQPWERGWRLPRGRRDFDGEGRGWTSFSATCRDHPGAFLWPDYDRHGHTGFAWAARRELLDRHGLYAHAIAGNADHLMAHAIFGDWNASCVRRLLGINTPSAAHYRKWAKPFWSDVKDNFATVPGDVLHLWHGELINRRYLPRAKELLAFDYDPDRDVRVDGGGALEWASARPELHRWSTEYYQQRREDGDDQPASAAIS
jgi:hypothetical protein